MVCYHASDKSDNAFARICTLAPNPETEVSDENKQGFLSRYRMHQLVFSIHQQAKAFGRGVGDVPVQGNLGLLSPDERRELWAGQARFRTCKVAS